MNPKIEWTTEQEKLLQELCRSGQYNYQSMTPLFPGRSKESLAGRANKLGINNRFRLPPKYTYNTDYFNEVNLETCYWGAILQTDGCLSVRENGYMTVVWSCAVKDKPLMELFRQHINSTHPIHMQLKKCKLSTSDKEKTHLQCKIIFEGAFKWAEALKRNFGFDRNKTLRTCSFNLPTLRHKLAYLKGFVDGDGCITQTGTQGGTQFSVCGSNKEMIQWVRDTVSDLNIPTLSNRVNNVCLRKDESCYYWKFGGLSAAILHQLLIRVPTPALARKWESPKVLKTIEYWKSRTDVWPPESFFTNILKGNP